MTLKEGEIIAEHYLLRRQLGTGSFGDVWLAQNLLADIDVAIKFYGTLDESGLQGFRNEFKVAYKLRHPNLLNINHFDVFNNCPYLVMPYCENGSVRQYVGKMQEREIWKFVSDVTCGLAFLHGQDPPIVHQDIKPDNILVTSDGHYVISDFGISRSLRTELSRSNNISGSSGTIAYMGPERFSERPVTVLASDIWALGMTLYEVVTGGVLWEGMGGCVQLNGARLPKMDSISPKLAKLILACLSAETWNRPSASQIYQYASAYLQHRQLPTLIDQYNVSDDTPTYAGNTNAPVASSMSATDYQHIPKATFHSNKKILAVAAAVMGGVILASGILLARNSLSEERDFGNCKSKEDFEQFIKDYPNSPHVAVARMRIASMNPIVAVSEQQEESQEERTEETQEQITATKERPTKAVRAVEDVHVIVEDSKTLPSKDTNGKALIGQPTRQPMGSTTDADDDASFRACSSVYAYKDYLQRFPNGRHRADAERAIKNLRTQNDIDNNAEQPQHRRGLRQRPRGSQTITIRPAEMPERPHRHRQDNGRSHDNWRR